MTALWRGTMSAAAIVLDPAVIGTTEARRRAFKLGGRTRLRELPDGRWLAMLAEPFELRAERAPGQPLVASRGGLSVPGIDGTADAITWLVAGAARTALLAGLPDVPTEDWVDLRSAPVYRLHPLDEPEPPPERPAEPDGVRAPDLRTAAGVRSRSRRGRPAGSGVGREPGRFGRWFTDLAGAPAQGMMQRRHARYLRKLTEDLDRRRWDDLLSEGIGLGTGGNAGWLTLRMPKRRNDLGLTLRPAAGGSVAMAPNAYGYLRALYLEAAKSLEDAGDIERATFVHAELLRDASAAVALLERQGRLQLAAELAEARKLPPDQVVRLWWRAGDRDRAVRVARAERAFAAAVPRLAEVDAEAASALRSAWVADCRAAGDHVGTVHAAWADPALRAGVVPDLERGMALGGTTSGMLLARLLALHATPAAADQAVALLGTEDGTLRRTRAAFVAELASVPCGDPAVDRRVCTAAVRALYRSDDLVDRRRLLNELGKRADPLVRADRATLPATRPHEPVPDLYAPETPGQLPVLDAVMLPGRVLLTAHGDHGVRLLGTDGRTRARWDVVAHQLVVPDHGSAVLLVRYAGGLREISRLDLVTRRVRPWTTLPECHIVESFDGTGLITIDADGVTFLDTLSSQPRVLWRELDRTRRAVRITRTPERLTALTDTPPDYARDPQLWIWALPSRTLRVRRRLEFGGPLADLAVCDGVLTALGITEGGDSTLTHFAEYRDAVTTTAPADATLLASGTASGLLRRAGEQVLCTIETGGRTLYTVFPRDGGTVRLREHAGLVTVWDAGGRIVVADPTADGTDGVLASITTTA